MKDQKFETGDRGERDHTEGSGNKSNRQGGGPGEKQNNAGEQGAKGEDSDKYTNSHTKPGDVHGHGSLKDGSDKDQAEEDRNTGLHLGDDFRIHNQTGEQNEDVRRQTGTANHKGGESDGSGGGKSSGGAGHGPQGNTDDKSKNQAGTNDNSGNKSNSGGTPPDKDKSGGEHQHGGEFPPRTRQDPNIEGSSAGSH